MIARCPQCSRPWSEASLDCHEHALHEAATVRVAGAANGDDVAFGRPSRIGVRATARCGITHHLGCACHEERRDAELAAAREECERLRAELARVTDERDETRRDVAKREDAAFVDGATKMQRMVADEILGFVGTIKDTAATTDGTAAETLRRVADLVECLAGQIRDMTFEVGHAPALRALVEVKP